MKNKLFLLILSVIIVGMISLSTILNLGIKAKISDKQIDKQTNKKFEDEAKYGKAVFAGGCFWCTEAAFDYVDGVEETISGYIGGDSNKADYKQVSQGGSGHYEALRVTYDKQKLNYEDMLKTYWESIDPTDDGGQFADRGKQYQTAIFYSNKDEKQVAEKSKIDMEKLIGQKIATRILPVREFHPAEKYHQNYHEKNPLHYKTYYYGSGRASGLKEIWKKKK